MRLDEREDRQIRDCCVSLKVDLRKKNPKQQKFRLRTSNCRPQMRSGVIICSLKMPFKAKINYVLLKSLEQILI